MNIFVLDTNPALAAQYHCDQHLHKMILESAQMLSTVVSHYASKRNVDLFTGYYKPTHSDHPCTEWLRESLYNCAWLVSLCEELENQRFAASNCAEHGSMKIIKLFTDDFLSGDCIYNEPKYGTDFFTFAGPEVIKIRPDLSTVQKYRKYYHLKNQQWIRDGKGPMTWKNRIEPEWMTSWPKEDN